MLKSRGHVGYSIKEVHKSVAWLIWLLPDRLNLCEANASILTPVVLHTLLYELILIHITAVCIVADIKIGAPPYVACVLLAVFLSRSLAHTENE